MNEVTPIHGLWTYEQTAAYFGTTQADSISIRSIMRLCQQGKLRRVYPTPRKPRIDPQSVLQYIDCLNAKDYDNHAQGGGCQIGVRPWRKSIPAKTPPIGGRDTATRMGSKLDALLKSRKGANQKR